jgi:alkanesulfonate monooxygenase SsuD/methylene tetrahydromethanopterin reductase-like flavin-dependent oxidoreductase (luciferase family)
MKVLWFHLMPYPDLPPDFRDKHPSVWVDIDSKLFDPARAHAVYNEYLDEFDYAESRGFDGLCVNEHHSNGYGLMPSPNLMASILAHRTRDAAICVMGNSLALYNPPTRVAEEMAMLDCISGGRLIAGFPVGTPMDTCYAYGQNPSSLRQRYYEAHDLVLKAWTEDKPFAFNGRFNQQRYVNIWPRPVQKPRPPIWIPGGGSVETWQWCAEKDYVYAYLSYFGYKAGEATMKGFWREVERQGKEPNPYRAGFLQFVGVGENHAEAMKLYKEPAEYFYNACLHLDPRFANPPGYTSEASIRSRIKGMVAQAAAGGGAAKSANRGDASKAVQAQGARAGHEIAREWQGILDLGYVMAGSPDEVADQIRKAAKNLNVGHLMLLLHFGNMSADLTRYNTKLFADRVLPQIKDLFDDQWEDHWWPRPMPTQQRAQHARPVVGAYGHA